jgi:hypothetical protein
MVTILKPLRHRPDNGPEISSENLPGNEELAEKGGTEHDKVPKGIELDEGDTSAGTGSAPGEGPNPTA